MSVPAQPVPETVHASLSGSVDIEMYRRCAQNLSVCVNNGVKSLHLLFQSTGGSVSEGVALYNLFRSVPVEINIFNGGSVSSIAAIAFLGAKKRYASASAVFMVHRTHSIPNMPSANAQRLRGLANSFDVDDARTRAILESHLTISKKRLTHHLTSEYPIDAKTALAYGLITEIKDFAVPLGEKLAII